MDAVLVVGLWLFVVTHLDTLVVLTAFCADADYRTGEVFIGHYLGFTVGLVGALLGAVLAAELLGEWTFLLGSVPLSIGLWGLLRHPPEETIETLPTVPNAAGRIGVVALAGVGLSGENIAVYVPFFVELAPRELALIVGLYIVGAAGVFLAAHVLMHQVAPDGLPDWLDRWLVPAVLVVIGGYVVVAGLLVG